jgi:hypothetical protein
VILIAPLTGSFELAGPISQEVPTIQPPGIHTELRSIAKCKMKNENLKLFLLFILNFAICNFQFAIFQNLYPLFSGTQSK